MSSDIEGLLFWRVPKGLAGVVEQDAIPRAATAPAVTPSPGRSMSICRMGVREEVVI